jgi:hypothetical protein
MCGAHTQADFPAFYPNMQIAESKGVRHFPCAFGYQPLDETNVFIV